MSAIGRRGFLKWCFISSAAMALSYYGLQAFRPFDLTFPSRELEGSFYKKLDKNQVQCRLCHHNCVIPAGKTSLCRTRVNRKGALYSRVYNRPAAVAVDPVEKEPLYHFLPGSGMLCIGTTGCNFSCKYCQNWQLSQQDIKDLDNVENYGADEIISIANRRKVPIISFTYNEPTVQYEYMHEIAALAGEKGLKVVMHSNGFMNPEPLAGLLPLLSAITIDLKGFTDGFYSDVAGGSLDPVLNNLVRIREAGTWLEVVNLVVPGLNDQPQSIESMCRWLAENLGKDTPLHFSRFFPSYRLAEQAPTPLETLERARQAAVSEGLKYVTLGNVPGHKYNSTYCPSCGAILVERNHIAVKNIFMEDGKCSNCAEEIPGVWA